MISRRIEVERITVICQQPLEAVASALRSRLGRPDIRRLTQAITAARDFREVEAIVAEHSSRAGLLLFLELDLGGILRKENGLDSPKILRFLIGNPLIMKEMARHLPDAGSYAPVTVLLHEQTDGTHLTYDKMTSLLSPYGSPAALAVAAELDVKMVTLLETVAVESRINQDAP